MHCNCLDVVEAKKSSHAPVQENIFSNQYFVIAAPIQTCAEKKATRAEIVWLWPLPAGQSPNVPDHSL